MQSAEVIKAARRRRRLTQRQMAAAAGVPQSVIARYEAGAVSPSLERLTSLLDAIGLDLNVALKAHQARPQRPHIHQLAEARSLGYHRLIAEKVRSNPELLARARDRVEGWLSGRLPFAGDPEYAGAWKEVLGRSSAHVIRVLTADDERSRELRQNTPFAGVLTPGEITGVLVEVRRFQGKRQKASNDTSSST